MQPEQSPEQLLSCWVTTGKVRPQDPDIPHLTEQHERQQARDPKRSMGASPLGVLHKLYLALTPQKGAYRYIKPHAIYIVSINLHSSSHSLQLSNFKKGKTKQNPSCVLDSAL